jgi:hypothetical protein
MSSLQALKNMTINLRILLTEQQSQLGFARDVAEVERGLDVVVDCLNQASEDVLRLGEAMCGRTVSERDLDVLTAIAQKSVRRFRDEFDRWKNTCLH